MIPRSVRALAALAPIAWSAGCAARGAPPAGAPEPELERRIVQATAPDSAVHVVFDWSVRERDARFSGRGAARVQSGYRARLDLFGPRGEAYLSAAVVGDELRLPPRVPTTAVPPPPLLWSVLGVLRPPAAATLVATEAEGERIRLVYRGPDGRWTYDYDGARLRGAEWVRPDGSRRTVELQGEAPHGLPREATYRDWDAFTELKLTLEEVEHVEPFPAETWTPGHR